MKLARSLSTAVLAALAVTSAAHAGAAAAGSQEAPPAPAAVAAASPAAAAPGVPKLELQRAVDGGPDSILVVRAQLVQLLMNDPKSKELHYWVGYADYRLVPRVMKDKAAAGRYLEEGLQHLEQAIKLDAGFADAIALEAGFRGLSIMLEPARGPALSGEIEEALGRASALAPKNPRVALIDAINTFNKPRFVGGGVDKALVKLKKAQELFAAEGTSRAPAIDWGHDDAYAWAGRAAEKLEQYGDARRYFRKALEINPGNAWVKWVLIPELDQAAKGKS